jgi:hypothetical protein
MSARIDTRNGHLPKSYRSFDLCPLSSIGNLGSILAEEEARVAAPIKTQPKDIS